MGKFAWEEEDMIGVSVEPSMSDASRKELEDEIERVDALLRAAGFDDSVIGDAAPMTLYVNRPVLNAAEIVTWFKGQGFKTTLPASELHVTVAYSRNPVDWMKAGEAWEEELTINAGGPRVLEKLGDYTVLSFASSSLRWRHEQFKDAGASWDHPDYQPHISISLGEAPAGAKPFTGRILLGPEKFEELESDWMEGITEE